ncbi:ATP-binding protein [Haematobacter missouriensis]|uniref:ATP-binding protein n=1 Tax=Haematobacter missouriensis TaxID=366616 RepID=UPI0030B865F4
MPRRIVITGGPGSGKTSLVMALAAEGLTIMPEAGRALIRAGRAIDGPALPWRDPALFAETMLAWEIRSHAAADDLSGPVIFDRGVPDVAGYLRTIGRSVPSHVQRAMERFRYDDPVFLAPYWPEIFGPDRERRQDAAEARATAEAMRHTYTEAGYRLVELPRASIAERAAFVHRVLGGTCAPDPGKPDPEKPDGATLDLGKQYPDRPHQGQA